jgi:acetyl esterase/lipase
MKRKIWSMKAKICLESGGCSPASPTLKALGLHSLLLMFTAALILVAPLKAAAQLAPPAPPADVHNPGSQFYDHKFNLVNLECSGREVDVYLPVKNQPTETFAAVVYGHGQALGIGSYEETFKHLAGKGIAVIFPAYDTGFFDQNWARMGDDYVRLADCALAQEPDINRTEVIYSGHSKGAYVASIAAGSAVRLKSIGEPRAALLFETAGADEPSLAKMSPALLLTVIFSDRDTTVAKELSDTVFAKSSSLRKQFITVKSYDQTSPQLAADHFWPLTSSTFFGGTSPCALHYFGSWKWLTAAAFDVMTGGKGTNPYLYGNLTGDKGLPGLQDDVRRNF